MVIGSNLNERSICLTGGLLAHYLKETIEMIKLCAWLFAVSVPIAFAAALIASAILLWREVL